MDDTRLSYREPENTEVENGPASGREPTIEELVDAHESALAAVRDAQSEADELAERIKQRVDADRNRLNAITAKVLGTAAPEATDPLDEPAGAVPQGESAPEPEPERKATNRVKRGLDGERMLIALPRGDSRSSGDIMDVAVALGMVAPNKSKDPKMKRALKSIIDGWIDAKQVTWTGTKRGTRYTKR